MFVFVATDDGGLFPMIEAHLQLDANRAGRTFADAQAPRLHTLHGQALALHVKGLRCRVPARLDLHERVPIRQHQIDGGVAA